MKFFFDECVPPPLARAIAALSEKIQVDGAPLQIVHQRDHFQEQGTDDRMWMARLAEEGGWVVVSCDTRIKKSLNEKIAWLESALTVFFLQERFPRADEWAQAQWLIRCWRPIVQAAENTPTGVGYIAHENGKLERLEMDKLRAGLPRDKIRLAKSTA